ncbi:MAG: alkaline phosphatase family protein [Erythrobacter sp.]
MWFLVDGLPFKLVEKFADQPHLPNLRGALANGKAWPLSNTRPNCQTPPSLAALWSGTGPTESGIIGYDLPDLPGRPTGFSPAFEHYPKNLNWIWNAYADACEGIRLCHIPFVDPERLGSGLQSYSYGFIPPLSPPCVEELVSSQARRDGVRTQDGRLIALHEGEWAPAMHGKAVGELEQAVSRWPLRAQSFGKAYRSGLLGPPMSIGGDGTAERLLAGSIDTLSERYYEEFLFCVRLNDARLVVGYQPAMDLLLHELAGYLDESNLLYSPARQAVALDLILPALRKLDRFLEQFKRACGANDRALICSDHGMGSIDRILRPNVALLELGFLQADSEGRIDPELSTCFFHPSEAGFLTFNVRQMNAKGISTKEVLDKLTERIFEDCGASAEFLQHEWNASSDNWDVSWFLRPPKHFQAKSNVTGDLIVPAIKTGDHAVTSADPMLLGTLIEVGALECVPKNTDIFNILEVKATFSHFG